MKCPTGTQLEIHEKTTSQKILKQQGNGCKNVSVHTPVTKEQGKFGCRIGKLGYLGTVSA